MTIQLRLIRPFTVTPDNLTSSIPESEAEYNIGVTYAAGEVVQDTIGAEATHHLFESVAAGNLGNPLTDESKWIDLGATNRWAMFDSVNGTQTISDNNIEVEIEVTGRADGLALLNMSGETVAVAMEDDGGNLVYDETFSLVSAAGITSWYAYFSETIAYDSELVLTDLPLYSNPTITVVVSSDSGDVAVGTLVVGQSAELGMTQLGARGGITDYSRKTTDDFGNVSLIERAYAKRVSFRTVVENSLVDQVFDILTAVRAVPCVWVGAEDYRLTWVYGWAREWATEITYHTHSFVTLEIEGLT